MEKIEVEKGYCPNCWGRQEYQDKLYDVVKSQKIDLNNIKEKKGWIQAYAAKYLGGLKLYENNGKQKCPSCSVEYNEKP